MYFVNRLVALAAFAAAAAPNTSYSQASVEASDTKCQSSVAAALKSPAGVLPEYRMRFPNAKFVGFFSKEINGCIASVQHTLANQWVILDTEGKILGDHATLFTCDRGGVNNVILEKARNYKGKNFHRHYKAFMDDGQGGVPKILRRTGRRYSVQDCQKVFDKKIHGLRSGE